MLEIEIIAAPGIGCCRVRIGRTLFLCLLSFAGFSHWHW